VGWVVVVGGRECVVANMGMGKRLKQLDEIMRTDLMLSPSYIHFFKLYAPPLLPLHPMYYTRTYPFSYLYMYIITGQYFLRALLSLIGSSSIK
jgi:hypothetical protein